MRRATLHLVAAAVLLLAAGCASADDDGAGTTTSPSASSSDAMSSSPSPTASETVDKAVEITVSVRDGKVMPKPHRVEVPLGSEIRLQVTSDVDDELHVHGFDVEKELEAGRTTTVELQADQAGLYEVETHETELELLQLEIR